MTSDSARSGLDVAPERVEPVHPHVPYSSKKRLRNARGNTSNDVRRMDMLILNCKLYSLHNSSLPCRADLLSTLKRNKRQLEIVRRLLQRCLLLWLEIRLIIETESYRGRARTKLACSDESVFRSSDPRLAMLRVASVKLCLGIH